MSSRSDRFRQYVLQLADYLVDNEGLHPDDVEELIDIYKKDVLAWESKNVPIENVARALNNRMKALLAIPIPNPREAGHDLPRRVFFLEVQRILVEKWHLTPGRARSAMRKFEVSAHVAYDEGVSEGRMARAIANALVRE